MKYEKFVKPQFNGESLPRLIHQQFHNHSIFASTKDLAKYKDDTRDKGVKLTAGVIRWSLFPRKLFVWLMIRMKQPAFYRRAYMYLEYSEEGLPWRI
jgi:hypothetical protein